MGRCTHPRCTMDARVRFVVVERFTRDFEKPFIALCMTHTAALEKRFSLVDELSNIRDLERWQAKEIAAFYNGMASA